MNASLTFRMILVLGQALVISPGALAQAKDEASVRSPAGGGRSAIINKLEHIRLDTVAYDGLPLSEVVNQLRDESVKRDPDKKGINFMINPNAPSAVEPPGGVPTEAVDIAAISVRIRPALSDVRLVDVLDAVVKVADHPVKYCIEDYGIVFSLQGAEQVRSEAGFVFAGGSPGELVRAVQEQYKVDWLSVADIPKEMEDVRIPRLRIHPISLRPVSGRPAEESGPLGALVSLYNQLGEQKPELGHLIVKGDLARPTVVVFVPDKGTSDTQPKIKVKAFSLYGITAAERERLLVDIDRAKGQAIDYAGHLRGVPGARNLEGMVAIHNETSLLVATGPESFVEMVESIVAAWQTKERAGIAGAGTAPATVPAK